jgi:UMF1 family MFS transporter
MIGVTAYVTGNPRLGVLTIAVLFVAGGVVLWRVDEREGERIARAWPAR